MLLSTVKRLLFTCSTQDELLDTVYWMRQIFALLCGIIWGGLPLKGLPAFIG